TIGGKPCIISFNRDVSDRHELEDALRDKQSRIDLAARASQVGFWDWQLNDNRIYFSPEWKAQIGYLDHEINNDFEEWRSRVHADDLKRVMAAVNAYLSGEAQDYQTEFRFRHKDGSYRWIYVRAEATRDNQGKAMRFVGCHIDITKQKKAEAERELLMQRLSQLQRLEAMGT